MSTSATKHHDVDIHDEVFLASRYDAFAQLRSACPVAHSNSHGGYWLLTRQADVRAAALDWRTYTSAVPGVTANPIITQRTTPQLPIELDPPQHSRYRALVNPVFTPERVEAVRPQIGRLARTLLDSIARQGKAELVADLCVPIAINSLAAFTDLPLQDSHLWIAWVQRMFNVHDRDDGAIATKEMGAYVDTLISERRRAPAGDFLSMLMAVEVDGHRLDDSQIHSFVTVLFGAGFETTADSLSIMLLWLFEHPGDVARLTADPALLPTAVEEFLRYASPIQVFGRNTTRDVVLHGCTIPKGDIVGLAFGSANHDADAFPEPDRVQLDRTPNRHLTFGAGPHLCAGAGVARMEMAVLLAALIEAEIGFQFDPGRPVEWKTRGDRNGLARLPVVVERSDMRS